MANQPDSGPGSRPALDLEALEQHLASLRTSIALTEELLAKARATLAATPAVPAGDDEEPLDDPSAPPRMRPAA